MTTRRDFLGGLLAVASAWLVPRWFKATPALTARQVEAWDWDRYPDGPDGDSGVWGGEGRYLTNREVGAFRTEPASFLAPPGSVNRLDWIVWDPSVARDVAAQMSRR